MIRVLRIKLYVFNKVIHKQGGPEASAFVLYSKLLTKFRNQESQRNMRKEEYWNDWSTNTTEENWDKKLLRLYNIWWYIHNIWNTSGWYDSVVRLVFFRRTYNTFTYKILCKIFFDHILKTHVM